MFGESTQPVLILIGILAAALTIWIMTSTWTRTVGRTWLGRIWHRKAEAPDSLEDVIAGAGYSYDPAQDVFYSNRDAWQRNMGYARLYDEAASTMGMIIDCEPIRFRYRGDRWLIEFWKGQYGMTSGGEIGVYKAVGASDEEEEGIAGGILKEAISYLYYDCAGDEDLLHMAFYLQKNGSYLMHREDDHWWLTGFKLGEFSEPWELSMYAYVTLKDQEMTEAFLSGLLHAGYQREEITVSDRTVSFHFDKPKTRQPITRQAETDRFVQRNNRKFCELYRNLTDQYQEINKKLEAVRDQAPELFAVLLMMGRSTGLVKLHKQVRDLGKADGTKG